MKTMVKLLCTEDIHLLRENKGKAIFAIRPYADLVIPGDALLYAYVNSFVISIDKDRLIVHRE